MVVIVVIFGGVLVVSAFAVLVLRTWGLGLNRTETELHAPGVHTVTYAVPPGRDPAEFCAALALAGYRAIEEDPTTLLVECPCADDPEKVRTLLANA